MPPEAPDAATSADDWRRLKEVVGEVLEVDAARRGARIAELTHGDAALRARVEAWLRPQDEAAGFLDAPAPGATWGRAAEPSPLEPGTHVDGFVIERRLATGGSSVVYAARQLQPARDVALKVFSGGLGGPRARARFALEAEILAGLRHPGIAQVIAAGVLVSEGAELPYLAVERVEGARTLIEHVRAEQLPRRARVELLVAVARAVDHGHRRGVIHRDVKPDNVLVDAEGNPRVIDFGLATAREGARRTAGVTLPGSFLGTLAYMSPEHAASDGGKIDVRSDVYSLGVLAFEVLCDERPYRLEDMSLGAAITVICEAAPKRPSSLGAPRDLESILLKALEKDPDRRYASGGDLADDLERWLAGAPVLARGASLPYHARHFLRRHRAAALTTLGALVVVVGGAFASSTRAARVEARERARLTEVKEFLLSVLELTGPGVSGRHDTTVVELLDRAAPRIDAELEQNPLAALELHATVGRAYRDLGRHDAAAHHLRRAAELGRRDGSPVAVASTLSALSDVWLEAGRPEEAARALVEALEVAEARQGSSPVFAAIARRKLAEAQRQLGRTEEAERLATRALREYEDALGPGHAGIARAAETLARVHLDAGHPEEALRLARRSLALDIVHGGAESLATARVRLLLAAALEGSGDAAAAALEADLAERLLERIVPPEHPLRAARRPSAGAPPTAN